MIKRMTLSAMLACTTMACASSQTMLPQPASTAEEASQTVAAQEGADGAAQGEAVTAIAAATPESSGRRRRVG